MCRSGEVSRYDVQRWLVHLLTRYGYAYASNHFRALQQFFRWLARRPGAGPVSAGQLTAWPGVATRAVAGNE